MPAHSHRLVPDCLVSVAGKKLDLDKDSALTRVDIDLDVDLFGQCVLTFHDPKLTLIDGKDFESGTAVKVEVGFHTKLKKVFEGEVVALEQEIAGSFDPVKQLLKDRDDAAAELRKATKAKDQAKINDATQVLETRSEALENAINEWTPPAGNQAAKDRKTKWDQQIKLRDDNRKLADGCAEKIAGTVAELDEDTDVNDVIELEKQLAVVEKKLAEAQRKLAKKAITKAERDVVKQDRDTRVQDIEARKQKLADKWIDELVANRAGVFAADHLRVCDLEEKCQMKFDYTLIELPSGGGKKTAIEDLLAQLEGLKPWNGDLVLADEAVASQSSSAPASQSSGAAAPH
jgi:hypothetical protein